MNKKAFTLIELLVVVLIIGILSTIALPQYRVAVGKSRFITSFALGKALKQAQEEYYLANGYYATTWNEIEGVLPKDINLAENATHFSGPNDTGWSINAQCILIWGSKVPEVHFFYDHINDPLAGKNTCTAYTNNALMTQICKSFGGNELSRGSETGNTWVRYEVK